MARGGVDVYLFPAIVGGGFGDIEEVLAAGRRLSRAGFRIHLYRRSGHPLPSGVDGPWDWPMLERPDRLHPGGHAAMTVVPAWGVSAATERPGPFGRGGPWADEAADVERAYGADRTLHVSLEEFARTLTSRQENLERLREGGVRSRELPARLAKARALGEVAAFDRAFRLFRAFDRPNVLHVFATFQRSAQFAREFPEAVQTGPLWPERYRRTAKRGSRRSGKWVWYASPASAEGIAPLVAKGLAAARPSTNLYVRSPRAWRTAFDPSRVEIDTGRVGDAAWRARFVEADLRIVTGSRTLLEALEVGGPFLYFNGTLGSGAGRRRHRPEKMDAFLALARTQDWSRDLLRDLSDFAHGHRIPEIVARAVERKGGWSRFPSTLVPAGFRRPYDDAGTVLVRVARSLAAPTASSIATVSRFRRRSNP